MHKQIEGREGWKVLAHKIGTKGPGVLYQGAGAAFAGQLFGHFSWFAVYNVRFSSKKIKQCSFSLGIH